MAEQHSPREARMTVMGSDEEVVVPFVEDMPQVYVEWDEPGAGGIVLDGVRAISFGIETDWSDTWDPRVHASALAFMDRLPRWSQEVTHAYWCAKHYAARTAAPTKEDDCDGK